MASTPRKTLIRRKLAVGESQDIKVRGRFFYITEASGPLSVGMDSESPDPFDVGTGYVGEPGEHFQFVRVQNRHAEENEIEIVIGDGEYRDNRFTLVPSRDFALPVMDAPSVIVSRFSGSLAGAANVEADENYTDPRYLRRKMLLVSNEDTSLKVQVRDGDGAVCAIVFPETSVMLPAAGWVEVFNPNGSAVQVHVSEIIFFKEVSVT